MASNITLPLTNPVNDVPILGPTGIAVSDVGSVAEEVIGADPVRRGILFHNPGSVTIRIAPSNMSLVPGSGGIVIYPQSDFPLIEGDNPFFNINTAWKAVADSGESNPLTILDFTDNNQSVPAPNAVSRLNVSVPITSPAGSGIADLGIVSEEVIGFNASRRGILFQNPGSVLIGLSPANLDAVIGAGSLILLPGQERRIFARGRVRINCGWNAIAESGSGNKLTVLEFL